MAGFAFAVLAMVLALFGKRLVWAAGAAVPVIATIGYLAVSSHRTPSFEAWGLAMHGVQIVLIATLLHVAIGRPRHTTASPLGGR